MSKMDNTFTWGKTKGCTCDLSNYYTKSEVDNKENAIVQNIETLTQQTNNNTTYITANSENIVKINSNVNEVKTKFDNYYNKSEIDNKFDNYYDKTEIDNKLPVKFYKGEIRMFGTEEEFSNFNQQFNFILGQDYDIFEAGKYLLTGSFGSTGGSNYITENNLPYKEYILSSTSLWATGYGKDVPYFDAGINTNVEYIKTTTNYDIQTKSGVSGYNYNIKWNYGSQTKQEFMPSYQTVYIVKFLRDIK